MIAMTRKARAVGVLLGGSGLARMLTVRTPAVAALLKPCLSASGQLGAVSQVCTLAV